ncbi:MAG: regulatory protein RecX [Dorea sp.]|nr:regulatory protein RecX [Dorea sp.]
MTVTKIKALTKTRFQVYLDEEAAFVLYKGELRRYHLEEGEELSEETYREIRQNIVLKRAKLRAMHLLTDMDRTEYQLRSKLLMGGYPEDITDQAIEYVKSFGYLNDLEYARRFVESRKHAKSRRQLYALLSGKGLDSSLIEQVLEEGCRSEDAREAIRAILRKKRFDRETASEKERQRMYASLARKGFRYEDVGKVMSE